MNTILNPIAVLPRTVAPLGMASVRPIDGRAPGSGKVGAPAVAPVWLWRADANDVDALHDLYLRLSPEARRMRFFSPTPHISRSVAEHLCTSDPARYLVVLARLGSVDGPVVAEAEAVIDRDDRRTAEVALAVDDGWAGRGLGRQLLNTLHGLATDRDVETLTAEVLPDNVACNALMRSFGMSAQVTRGVITWRGPVARSTAPLAAPIAPALGWAA